MTAWMDFDVNLHLNYKNNKFISRMVNLEIHVIPVKAKRLSDDTAANSTGPNFSEWITSKKDLEISGRVWGCLKTAL
jgi:hypothetical protein